MQGYSLMAEEAMSQTPVVPSHVFVQGGVGGLAAGVCSYLWEHFRTNRPRYIVVEPAKADCIYRSAMAGRPTPAEGALDTIMAGLACGEVSLLAWRILERRRRRLHHHRRRSGRRMHAPARRRASR